MAPAPGWQAKYDWAGSIPFEQLPRSFNPASGAIVTANHRITPPGYPNFISSEWQPPYRADRIQQLLDATPKHTAQSFARIQADVTSLAMRELLPKLLATRPRSEEARQALALVAKWDGAMVPARAEPLIASAWWRELARAIYADELGDAFRQNWLSRAVFIGKVLSGDPGLARWCDDVRTPATESCEEVLALSLDAALADLAKRYGADPAKWRWGDAHIARHEHRPFGRQPQLAKLFDITVPSPGDAYTVNVGRNNLNDEAQPFANRHAASLRATAIYRIWRNPSTSTRRSVGKHPVRPLQGVQRSWARNNTFPCTPSASWIGPPAAAAYASGKPAASALSVRRWSLGPPPINARRDGHSEGHYAQHRDFRAGAQHRLWDCVPAGSSPRLAAAIEEDERDTRGLLRTVGPGMVGAALDQHVARAHEGFALVHHRPDFSNRRQMIVSVRCMPGCALALCCASWNMPVKVPDAALRSAGSAAPAGNR
jgi:hypothetical protein